MDLKPSCKCYLKYCALSFCLFILFSHFILSLIIIRDYYYSISILQASSMYMVLWYLHDFIFYVWWNHYIRLRYHIIDQPGCWKRMFWVHTAVHIIWVNILSSIKVIQTIKSPVSAMKLEKQLWVPKKLWQLFSATVCPNDTKICEEIHDCIL